MLTRTALIAAVAFAVAGPAFAADEGKATPNPWVDCGIGAMVFPTTNVGAVLSNVIWDYGITATTSAMSSPSTCEGHRVKTAMFINNSYDQLAADTAAGRGKYVEALADLANCDADSRSQLVSLVRTGLAIDMAKPEFTVMSNTGKAEAFYNVVDRVVAKDLAGRCSIDA
jgi:hypothetical protein